MGTGRRSALRPSRAILNYGKVCRTAVLEAMLDENKWVGTPEYAAAMVSHERSVGSFDLL